MSIVKPYQSNSRVRRDGYDDVRIYALREQNREYASRLNDYITRRQKDEWMSEDELNGYRDALERYKTSSRSLSNIQRSFGSYSDEDEKQRTSYIDSIAADLDSSSGMFKSYKNADEYGAAVKAYDTQKRQEAWKESYKGKTYKELSDYVRSVDYQKQRRMGDISDEEDSWLKNTYMKHDRDVVDSMTEDEMRKENDANNSRINKLNSELRVLESRKRAAALTPETYSPEYFDKKIEEKKREISDASVLYYDEDDAAMTYDSLLRIRKAENTLTNVQSESASEGMYNVLLDDSDRFDKIQRFQALTIGAIGSSDGNFTLTPGDDAERELFNYFSQNYGFDFTQPAYVLRNQINALSNEVGSKYEADKATFGSMGYNWDELAYYNKWKADKASYNQRMEEEKQKAIDHPVASTIVSILAAPFQVIEYAQNVGHTFKSGGDSAYGLANIYDDDLTNQIKTSSSAVAGKINEDVKNWTGSDTLAWLASGAYSGVTSSLQSHALNAACVALFGPAGEAIALGLMGTQSAANAFQDAVMNGSTNGEALATSIAAGIAEAAFEKISLEKIKGIKDLVNSKSWNTSTLRDLLKSALRNTGIVAVQGVVEGSEELCTDIANALADDIINGDHTAYKTDVRKFMNAGYSKEEAEQLANKNWIMGVMESFYGGFIGGTMSGSLQMAANVAAGMPQAIEGSIDKYHGIRNYGTSIIENDNIQRLTESAQDTGSKRLRALAEQVAGVDTSASDFSEKSKDRLVRDTGRLFYGVQEAQTKALDQAAKGDFTAKVRDVLTEQGVDNLDKATEAVMRSVEGKELSRAEKKLFDAVSGEEVIRTVQSSQMGERTADAYSQRLSTAALPFVSREDTELGGKKHVDVQDRVSATGHTVNTATGENITVNKENAIDRVENGEVYVNTDKGTVKLSSIEFANENEARLYESFLDYDSATASALIKNYDGGISVERYVNGMRQGINVYGKYNFQGVGIDISKDSFFADLSPTDQRYALNIGRSIARAEAQAAQRAVAAKTAAKTKGKVQFAEGVTAETKAQKNGVALAKHLASALGINITFFDSTKDVQHRNDNGWYDPETDSIHLDINAGDNHEGTIAYTLGHELTHFIKKWSPEKFKVFGDFLVEQYGKHGISTQELLESQMAKLNTTDEALAYEEMVADACQTMLLDSNAVEKLIHLRQQDKGLFEKIKEFIHNILAKLRKEYAGIDPNSDEAKALRSMTDVMEQMTALFEDAAVDAAQRHNGAEALTMAKPNEAIAVQDTHSGSVSPESGDISFSIRENANITARTQRYFEQHRDQSEHISEDALKAANDIVAEMARYMEPYLDITNNKGNRYLPEEILGKTTFKNGSYGKTIENTTICFRTLAYIDFTNEIKKRIGRPLTVEESFLASQMLYDIAKEPQCLYCYVSLDRKAYDGFLLEYMNQRDGVIEKYQALENRDKKSVDALYKEFLNGRKDTKPMQKRFAMWVDLAESGQQLLSNADLATEEVRSELLSNGGIMAAQVADAESYAQNASWAKKLEQYRSYNSDILSMSAAMVKKLNKHYGLRFYSFSEYTPAFIVENMQQIRDASVKGLYGLAYTKKPDFARIFASTGMNINISVFGRMDGGKVVADTLQGADWNEVKQLRKEHKNVGAVFVATNDTMTEWALSQDWIDVVIPFHIVRTGANVAEFYRWVNNTKDQADVDENGKNKTLTPAEFHNDRDTYMRLIRERGLTPRFSKWIDNPNYMKLVNETRLADTESERLHPTFNLTAAKQSFDAFVKDGGYYGNWYEEGADYGKAVDTVVSDVLAGKRANEVDYGRQDIDFSDAMKNRRERSHGQKFSTRTQENTGSALNEHSVQTALWDALDHKDGGDDNLIRVSRMPKYIRDQFLIDGDFYIYRDHAYENMVSEERAISEGRPITHRGKKIHFHNLGIEKMTKAILSIDHPTMAISTKTKDGNPAVVMILDEFGSNGAPLYAVLSFYSNRPINGQMERKPHIVFTVAERNYFGSTGRFGYKELITEAIKDGRVLDYDVKKRDNLSVIAEQARLGNITESSLTANLTHFRKEVNSFREKNHISYSTRNKSNRELLSEALETTIDSSAPMGQYEAKLLGQYRDNVELLDGLQAHLKEVNAEIRALTFGDAPRDPVRLRALKDEKIKTENRIGIYDKKLLRLEATQPLKDVLEREKKRVKQETVSAFRESTKERKAQSETRRKIKRIAEDFRRRLTHSTEYSYVPKQLAEGIISVCNEIDPTGYDQNSKAAERFRSGQTALLELKAQYDRLKTSSDYDFSSEFNEEFSSSIEALSEAVGDTPLREMSADQMEDVYGILSDIKGMLADATRQIGLSERISNYEAGQEVIKLMHQIKAKSLTTGALSGFFRNWTENPMRAVREMSAFDPNSRLIKLFDSLNEGRRKMETFRMDAYKEFDALRATKEGEKAFNEAVEKPYDFGLTDVDGNPLKISKMQAMQLVLTWNREQANPNRKHLQTGAIIPDVDLLRKGKYQAAFDNGQQIGMVTQETIASIMDGLSEWDKRYMEAARKLFNETARDAINETTMLTKHRIVAGEKEYIPYTVNEDYIAKDSDNVRFDATVEGMGMLKSVADNAPQMLVMGGLNQTLSKHIDSVGKYYGLAVPIRNWNKVFNMKQTASDGGRSVKSVLRGTWTDAGVKLLDQAVADLQTPRKHDSVKALSYIKSAFVQSALSSNISVWMKQAASYPTAGAILSNKALTKGLWDYVAKVKDGIRAQDVWDEIDAHTSQHWLRRQGMSMQELAEINQTGGWQNKLNKKLGKMSPMNWIQAMDVGTTAALWYACKAEVDGSKRFETGSEEYWNEVTALYDRVIEETQPMYDSLHRAEITKKQGLGNVIMFQTQPLQNSGILRESAMEYKMAKRQYGSTSEQSKTAGRKFRMAVMSQAASHFVFTAMTLTAQALLHKMNPWKDDDDKLTPKSIAEEFAKEFGKNYLGAIVPIFGTMGISLAEKLFGSSSYDVFSDSVVDKVNSTIDTFAKLKNPSFSAFANAFCEAASYLGIPAQNAYNIIRGFILNVNDIIGADHNAVIRAVEGGNQYNGKSLYEAIVSGDREWINAIREKNGYKDDSAYSTATKNALRNNDKRIKEAIKARVTGDSARYQQLRQTIINEGNFEKQIVSDAMNAEYSYFIGKIEDAAKLMKDGDTESSGDIIIALRKRYKGILKQDDIMTMVKRKAGLQK